MCFFYLERPFILTFVLVSPQVDVVFRTMPKTKTDYLRAVLRRFSNGSVIAEFSVFLTQNSNLNPKDFEDEMKDILGFTKGKMGGVEIVIDPEHITFTRKFSAAFFKENYRIGFANKTVAGSVDPPYP